MVDRLAEDDQARIDFLKACLIKLGLQANQEQSAVPSLSRLHLSSLRPADASELVASLNEIIFVQDGEEYIKDKHDTFHLEKPSTWFLSSIIHALPGVSNGKTDEDDDGVDRIQDYNSIVKRIVIHEEEHPASKETPYFNHDAFFANLKHFESSTRESCGAFGKYLLYGEVVTSTNTLLEKYVSRNLLDISISKTNDKYQQKYAAASTPPNWFHSHSDSSNCWSWSWLQRLGITCRLPDVLDLHSALNGDEHQSPHSICPIPCCSRYR